MEKLRHWLRRRVAEGRLREVRSSRRGIGLSHLFFADDLLIFSEACEEQLLCIRAGPDEFLNVQASLSIILSHLCSSLQM